MEGAAGFNPPVLSFLEFALYLLPFQINKFGLRHPGYPQIPKRFFVLKQVRFKNKKSTFPSRKINCFLTGAVAVYSLLWVV